jgi:hypothetical protein
MKKPRSLTRFALLFGAVALFSLLLMAAATVFGLMGLYGSGTDPSRAELVQTVIDFFIAVSYFFGALALLCGVAGFFNKADQPQSETP